MEIEKIEEEFQLMCFASIIVDGAFNFFKQNEKCSMLENRHLTSRYDKIDFLWIY